MLQQISQNNTRQSLATNQKANSPPSTYLSNRESASSNRQAPAAAAAVSAASPYNSAPSLSRTPDLETSTTNSSTAEKASQQKLLTFVPNQNIGDLSQFNFNLFDPTSALHWIQFAQHWHNTYQV